MVRSERAQVGRLAFVLYAKRRAQDRVRNEEGGGARDTADGETAPSLFLSATRLAPWPLIRARQI